MGLPVPDDMDGRVLTELFADGRAGADGRARSRGRDPEVVYTAEEEAAIEASLRGLGYIENRAVPRGQTPVLHSSSGGLTWSTSWSIAAGVGVGVVDLDERLPLVGQRVLGEDRLDRALRLAGAAVDALLGVDHQHPAHLVDAVHRADVDAGLVLQVDAGLGDDVRHETRPPGSSPSGADPSEPGRTTSSGNRSLQHRPRDHLGEARPGAPRAARWGSVCWPNPSTGTPGKRASTSAGSVRLTSAITRSGGGPARPWRSPRGRWQQHGVDLAAEEQVDAGQLDDAHSDSVMWLTQPFSTNVRSKNTSSPAATSTSPLNMRTRS